MLFSIKNLPIDLACKIPVLLKFLCVLQSSILKFLGSPNPGAILCLKKTTLALISLISDLKSSSLKTGFNE